MGKANLGNIERLCKKFEMYGMYCSWTPPDFQDQFGELFRSAPWIQEFSTSKIMEGSVHILFDTEEQMWDTYRQTRGTDSNGIVYACLCDSSGEIITENS